MLTNSGTLDLISKYYRFMSPLTVYLNLSFLNFEFGFWTLVYVFKTYTVLIEVSSILSSDIIFELIRTRTIFRKQQNIISHIIIMSNKKYIFVPNE